MPLYTDIAQLVRECGSDFLMSSGAANSLFPISVEECKKDLLGLNCMGEPIKHDGANIRFTQVAPTTGVAIGVDINARAHEIDKGGISTQVAGALVTKETCSFDHETLTAIHSANAGCASDAQLEAIGRSILGAFDTLSERFLSFIEKSFWEGATGQMSITMDNSTVPLTVNTGTTVLPSLVGSDVWTDAVNSSPLRDIDAMKSQFRATGFSPCKLVMNALTYEQFANADSVKGALGGCLCEVELKGETIPKIRGVELHVYDNGYLDDTGTFVPYIADGVVVMIGCRCGKTGAQRFDCINIDDCEGLTYGSHIEILKDKNPMQKAVYHSYIGAPVFTSPQAFVSLQVF